MTGPSNVAAANPRGTGLQCGTDFGEQKFADVVLAYPFGERYVPGRTTDLSFVRLLLTAPPAGSKQQSGIIAGE